MNSHGIPMNPSTTPIDPGAPAPDPLPTTIDPEKKAPAPEVNAPNTEVEAPDREMEPDTFRGRPNSATPSITGPQEDAPCEIRKHIERIMKAAGSNATASWPAGSEACYRLLSCVTPRMTSFRITLGSNDGGVREHDVTGTSLLHAIAVAIKREQERGFVATRLIVDSSGGTRYDGRPWPTTQR